jgi:hypothetical protein
VGAVGGRRRTRRGGTEPSGIARSAASPSRPEGSDVPSFPYQLVDTYLFEASVERKTSAEPAPTAPRFRTSYEAFDWPEGHGFIGRLTVEAVYPFRVEALCVIRCSTQGHFAAADKAPTNDEDAAQFRERDSAVLIWPYARAQVAEFVRMMNLSLPPLPTVDVRRALEQLPLDVDEQAELAPES